MKALCLVLALLNVALLLWQWRHDGLREALYEEASGHVLLRVDEQRKARTGAAISALMERNLDAWHREDLDRMLAHLRGEPRWQDHAMTLAKPIKRLPSVVATPVAAPKPVLVCIEAGPFVDAGTMKQWLKDKKISTHDMLVKSIDVLVDYQVYFPAAKTPEQSQINKQMLIAKGLLDVWMVPAGDNKGALSLGVFSDSQRAQNFKTQLQAQGINAEIKQRFKSRQQFYAKIMIEKARREQLAGKGLQMATCSR